MRLLGQRVGVDNPTQATNAELTLQVTVLQRDVVLPGGTQLSGANEFIYLTTADVDLDADLVSVRVRASGDPNDGGGAGPDGNLQVGDALQFVNPLAEVASEATVTQVEVTAAAAEDPEVYRGRVLDVQRKRPQGGAYADYEQWAESVEGIISVYPYTGDPGQVVVYCEATVTSSGSDDGIPTAAQQTAISNAINLNMDGRATRRPAGTFVVVNPILRSQFQATVSGITGVQELARVRQSIQNGLENYFAAAEPWIVGLSVAPRRDTLDKNRMLALVADITEAAGGSFTTFTFNLVGGSALDSYTVGQGEKARLSSVLFL